jgi:hypothetical protein
MMKRVKRMKKKLIPIVFLFVCVVLLFAGCGKKVNGPGIHFAEMVYDFGSADEGKKVPHNFVFSNPGNEPLIIKEVRPSCGCTITGEYDKEVKPGKQGKIPIVLDTTGFQGHTAKTIRVETNVPSQNTYTLTLEGNVKVQVEVNPRTLVLGKVDDETQQLSGIVTIINHTKNPMNITEIIPPNDKTEVTLNSIEQDKEYDLNITVLPPYRDGQITETIILKTDLAVKPQIDVRYSYFLPPILDVKPTEIYIDPDSITSGEAVREIYIYTSLDIPLEITNIDLTSGNIDYIIEETHPGELYKIVLTFNSGFAFSSDAPVYITFQIMNAPDSPVFTVPIKNAGNL